MSVARGFIGSGDVYLERFTVGVSQGLAGPYYANKLEIKPNVDIKELVSKGRYDYGQTLESVALQKPADFTLELKEINKESMALALLGSAANVSQASGTLVDAPVVIKKGFWVPVGKEELAATMLVKHSTGAPTYVEGTDYELRRSIGLIKVLAGSAIADGATLELSGDYAATSSTLISGAVSADVRCRIILDGVNQADGLRCTVTIHEGVIAASSAFDFLAGDFSDLALPGKMKTPVGKSEPFTVAIYNPTA
jgi:hypothetical protein